MSAPKPTEGGIDQVSFGIVRKGFDKDEVTKYLRGVEESFQDLERWTSTLRQQLTDAERKLADSRSAEAGAVDTAMVAVFDAKDRIIERANAEAAHAKEQAEIRVAAITSDAEKLLAVARSEAADLREAITDGDDSGIAAARVSAAEAEAARIIAEAEVRAAKIAAPAPQAADSLNERIALLESDLDAAQFEVVRVTAERERLTTDLREAEQSNAAAVAASMAEETVVEAERKVATLLAEASEVAERLQAEAEAKIADARSKFDLEAEADRLGVEADLAAGKAEMATLRDAASNAVAQREAAEAGAREEAKSIVEGATAEATQIVERANAEAAGLVGEAEAAVEEAQRVSAETVEAAKRESENQAAAALTVSEAQAKDLVTDAEQQAFGRAAGRRSRSRKDRGSCVQSRGRPRRNLGGQGRDRPQWRRGPRRGVGGQGGERCGSNHRGRPKEVESAR